MKKKRTEVVSRQDDLITSSAEGIDNGGVSKDARGAIDHVHTHRVQTSNQVRLVSIVVSEQQEGVGGIDGNVHCGRVDLWELNEVALLSTGKGKEKSEQGAYRLHCSERSV